MPLSIRIPGASFTNNIGSLVRRVEFANIAGATQSGNAVDGFVYSVAPAVTGWVADPDYKLPGAVESFYQCKVELDTSGLNLALPIMMLCSNNTTTSFADPDAIAGLFVERAGMVNTFKVTFVGSVVPANVNANVVYQEGGIYRLFRTASNTLLAQASNNNGWTWETIHNFGTITGELYPAWDFLVDGEAYTVGPVFVSQTAIAA